ncbi:putative K+/H+-antiporter [Handroanthus impetiginosus]|uniref:Putative K+/H+-antiporter n=1 Tax=Handroanthus impetiginosus TaxID=429701 RepID=A0A2G9HQH6_9LAMI|nr:putative K+/H+-antiporter [Handroanthus impetiginosus]
MSSVEVSSSKGYVQGPYEEDTLVCQFVHKTNAQGCAWFGGNTFAFTLPVLLLQFVTIFAVTSIIWFLLKPLKQGLISAQLIGGIVMGRSCLGQIHAYKEKLFPPGGRLILETVADLGFMFYLFILGVHSDMSLVKRVDRKVIVIGVTSFLAPLTIGLSAVFIICQLIELDISVKQSLPFVVSLNALSPFPVITSLLADLHILNSEMGRIATLSSLVVDISNYIVACVFGSIVICLRSQHLTSIWSLLWAAIFFTIIVFGLRPIIISVAERVPEGQQIKEIQFLTIILIVLSCGLVSEIFGQPPGLGPFLLGVVTPDGPPLGSSFVNKFDTIVIGLLVPAKFVISGLNMEFLSIRGVSGAIIGLVIFICYTAKFTGTLIPALRYKIRLRDAVVLALIMCCKGAIEAALYITLQEDGIISSEAYALLLISMLLVTGIARTLIWHLYDPSARYLGHTKNSFLINHPNDELRMLICIHNEDNVPALINLLAASTPTRSMPIAIFVLTLMELKGRAASVLDSNTRLKGKLTSSKSWSKQAVNAFNLFAQRNQGSVVVRHFTSIAPYSSMHDDIGTIAVDQNTNIVIVPFHKQWAFDGRVAADSPSLRMVNRNLIRKSPCSVGVLVDRGLIATNRGQSIFEVTLLFIGGVDDCEALAYCTRFIENTKIRLTFVWIRPWDHMKYNEEMEMRMDMELVNQFREKTIGNERISYKEELVNDAIGTTRVIRSINESGCELCIVGRHHEPSSPLVSGLNEWNECPELGLLGDMLATSDFQFSVLVVQQQTPGAAGFADSRRVQPIGSGYSSCTSFEDCESTRSYQEC